MQGDHRSGAARAVVQEEERIRRELATMKKILKTRKAEWDATGHDIDSDLPDLIQRTSDEVQRLTAELARITGATPPRPPPSKGQPKQAPPPPVVTTTTHSHIGGRGKGGKGLGKGGVMRHRKVLRDNIKGITKPAIRRLARRAGIKRISGEIYEETRAVLKSAFLEPIIRDAVLYAGHRNRGGGPHMAKTITYMDVIHALKRNGRTLYGFGTP